MPLSFVCHWEPPSKSNDYIVSKSVYTSQLLQKFKSIAKLDLIVEFTYCKSHDFKIIVYYIILYTEGFVWSVWCTSYIFYSKSSPELFEYMSSFSKAFFLNISYPNHSPCANDKKIHKKCIDNLESPRMFVFGLCLFFILGFFNSVYLVSVVLLIYT